MEQSMVVTNAHELMRSLEVASIMDCADMAAHASLFRTESRWGLYHNRADFPERDNENWFCHSLLSKNSSGAMSIEKKAVEPYIIPIDEEEKDAYQQQRVKVNS